MSQRIRRVWRVGPAALAAVWAFVLAAGVAVPILAFLVYRDLGTPWVPAILIVLTVLALLYAWRFGLHPRLLVDEETVEVINPFRRHQLSWDRIVLVAPGENGLIIASDDELVEAWCVQKSNYASRRGQLTRADQIAHELLDILDEYDPPLEDVETGLSIRRARPDEARLLTRLERASNEEVLGHIFPPEEFPYPVTAVTHRWRHVLRDPSVRVRILELRGAAVGFVAYDARSIRHLGVVSPHARRGYGSALLEHALTEIYDAGAAEASLWVLRGNTVARAFYARYGWTDSHDRRNSEYPPYPEEMRLVRTNPAAPRRWR